jgi:hypothetical protein
VSTVAKRELACPLTDLVVVVAQGENGIAVKLGTEGNVALVESTREVLGKAVPYSISGSLPLVRYLQDHDFDVQLCGSVPLAV